MFEGMEEQSDSKKETARPEKSVDPAETDKALYERAGNATYPGLTMFARDVNLSRDLEEKYKAGQIIREKALVDASIRFMGMITTHRYVILSNHMANLAPFEHGTNWGLHVGQRNSHFKVLGKVVAHGKTAIILLHLPDDEALWKVFLDASFSIDEEVYQMAADRFTVKCSGPAVPELTTEAWLSRCAFPIGINENGKLWPLTDKAPWERLDQYDYCDARYYSINEAHIIKRTLDDKLYSFYLPESKWYLNCALAAEFAWGETLPYTELNIDTDPYPCVDSNRPSMYQSDKRWKKQLCEGCLLGGAVGDALGYPVEFISEAEIKKRYGKNGIQQLLQAGTPAIISDDTQMTMFAANAIIYHACHKKELALPGCLKEAYREWYRTQFSTSTLGEKLASMWVFDDARMHAARAPGNTCLAAIAAFDDTSIAHHADNHSKGCGTVMRAAPFGFMPIHKQEGELNGVEAVIKNIARTDAALTHGHPAAQSSSAMLAAIIYRLTQTEIFRFHRLEDEIRQVKVGDAPLEERIQKAIRLAVDPNISDIDGIHTLGEGWVGDEALAIAVFCAVRYQNNFAAGIRAAVNHKGDSDSTGAICGNILGAWLGIGAVQTAFNTENLELSDMVINIADDLFAVEIGEVPKAGEDARWDSRYYQR